MNKDQYDEIMKPLNAISSDTNLLKDNAKK